MARDTKFKPGEGGRPKGARNKANQDVKALIDKAVSPEDWKLIFAKFAEKAKAGDEKAGKLLMEYKFGKPSEAVQVTGGDGGPIQHSIEGIDRESLGNLARAIARAKLTSSEG